MLPSRGHPRPNAPAMGAVVSAAGACQQFLLMANSSLGVPTVRRLAQKQEAPRIRIPVPPMILLTPGLHRTIFTLIDLLLPRMVIWPRWPRLVVTAMHAVSLSRLMLPFSRGARVRCLDAMVMLGTQPIRHQLVKFEANGGCSHRAERNVQDHGSVATDSPSHWRRVEAEGPGVGRLPPCRPGKGDAEPSLMSRAHRSRMVNGMNGMEAR